MSKRKRVKNYIDHNVQGALLRRIFLHWLLFFFIAGFAVVFLQALLGDVGVPLSKRLSLQAGKFMLFATVMLALLPAFMLDTVRFSNRFVGPITRLRRHMRQLKMGDTSRCAFRGNDYWKEMATEFNAVADLVEQQQAEIQRLKVAAGEVQATSATV